ncbi:MAG TPA: hypothetical protein VIU61_14630 [Kofleriaceae bacterium]
MKTNTLLALAAASSLTACIQKDAPPEDLARAIPTGDQVAINLPANANDSLALGQLAEWYVATRGVTLTFNGGSAWVLGLIHAIVQYPVTTVDGDTYTWGPWSSALDPAEYKLDVKDVGDGTYEYVLSGRSKTTAGAGFEKIIDGFADPRPGHLKGNGEFTVDFDAGKRANPIDPGDARGIVGVTYDLTARHLDLTIRSTDDNGAPVMAFYAYDEAADGSGDMVFDVEGDAGGTAANEQITLRSRWLQTGAGRADARLTGGDVGTGAIASECWDTGFRRVFYTDSVNFEPTEGTVGSCAFADQDLPPAK